ncbi:solute carrier family 2, facilitated glucose transporter member 11-like isoform X4 [Myiozetetes cayanensis]|uniref:solute carrier family 2, facilitated glucose transporter member 11-like isoform X4 n=1 Tax=Myiozetetes cayanensis TaxID=478635 RepID=UPI0021607437|nr:solute carrier family 2, facilitated glucose transporter member 11-like isoform X4 [Myiozetetes cayanensis]
MLLLLESFGSSCSFLNKYFHCSKLPSWTLFLAVCAVGIGGTFQYGYNVSIINAPTQHIHKFLNETWTSRYQKELNPDLLTFLWSVIASIFSLGGLCGALMGGSMAIRLGRKGALLMNNIIAILASILMGLSYPTGLFELLIAGRFLIGINTGIGFCVQPLYIGEIAPKHLRGGLAMGTSIFLTGGILTGQIIGLRELLGGEKHWPLLLSSSCFPAFAQLLFLPWFPESPRYLLIDRGDELSCAKALKRFHGSAEYRREMEDIQRESSALDGEKPKKPWQLFTDRGVRWQLITVIVMTIGQQLSGINAIYFYATYIFEAAGISAEKIPYVTLGTGAWFTDRLRGKKIPHHWGLSPHDPLVHCSNLLSDLPGPVPLGALREHDVYICLHLELWVGTRWHNQHPDSGVICTVLTSCCLHDRRDS